MLKNSLKIKKKALNMSLTNFLVKVKKKIQKIKIYHILAVFCNYFYESDNLYDELCLINLNDLINMKNSDESE